MWAASQEPTTGDLQGRSNMINIKTRVVVTEIIASSLAMFGIIVLICSFFPIINPSHYEVTFEYNEFGISRYILGGVLTGALFWFANRFNRKARLLRKTGVAK